MPCWAEVGVRDLVGSAGFYGAVLGWTVTDDDVPEHLDAIALVDGRPVAGLGSTPAASPAWTLYFATDDADATADRVEELGGTLLLGPEDVGPAGRLFVAVDLGGALFGGWEADRHLGTGVVGEPGAMIWVDAASAEPGSSRTFYRGLFGYRYEADPAVGPEYTTFHGDGPAALGGIGFAGDELPHWLVHFGVTDPDAAVEAALGAGGAVVRRAGTGAVLTDPAGARFGVTAR